MNAAHAALDLLKDHPDQAAVIGPVVNALTTKAAQADG